VKPKIDLRDIPKYVHAVQC